MKKSQKKKLKEVKMHQHQDAQGRIFGAPHPIDSEHNNERTQKYHDLTIKANS
jgi:hypothetical protein